MTLSLGRFAMAHSPPRLPAHPRRTSMSPTQPKPGPTRRGGRNLGLRFQQLEYSLRSTTREAALLADSSRLVEGQDPVLAHNKSRVPRERVEIFHGLVVPKEPTPPEPDECCMSGCSICVYDLYEDSLLTYKTSVASLRTELRSMGIQESEWPSRIRSSPNSQAINRPFSTSLDAFEAMEKALKVRQQGETQGGS